MTQPYFLLTALFASLPALLRVVDHPWNLAPAGAMAIFAGVHLRDKRWAFAIPLLSLFASDVAIGLKHNNVQEWTFHALLPLIYACFAAYILLGRCVRAAWTRIDAHRVSENTVEGRVTRPLSSGKRMTFKVLSLVGGTLGGAIVFFVVTNFGDFVYYYPHTWSELARCYERAIPFFRNTVRSDAFYVTALFAAYGLIRRGLESEESRELEASRF